MFRDARFRLRALFRGDRAETDLDDELRLHLELETEKYVVAGMPRAQAARQARLALGGLDSTKEACRDARGVNWLQTLRRDLAHAGRMVWKQPLFTATVVLSLALGIGGSVAIFTLLRAALWRPLPVAQPEQIVHVQRVVPGTPDQGNYGYSYVLFQQLRQAAEPGADVVAKSGYGLSWFGVTPAARERVTGEAVSANFFSSLKVGAFAGRLFEPPDDNALGGRRVAVLSYDFWRRRFQSDRSILGRTVYYRETPYSVVGIAQPRFDGVDAGSAIEIWVPISTDSPPVWLTDPKAYWLRLLARVAPDSDREQLAAKLDGVFRVHLNDLGSSAPISAQHLRLRPARAGLSTLGREYEQPLLLLMVSVTLVLLICCANLANLVMGHNRARRGEISLRRALGASRARIAAQLFAENVPLAIVGTLLGVLLAEKTTRLLISLLPGSQPPIVFDLQPDAAVLAFAAGLGCLTVVIFGLLPAFRASLLEGELTGKHSSGARRRSGAAGGLVAGQLAVSLVLMIGAGLFLGTIRNLQRADPGFRPEQIVTFDLSLPKAMPVERKRQVFSQLRERFDGAPGVVASTWAWPSVYGRFGASVNVAIDDRVQSSSGGNETGLIAAGPRFYEVMGIRLLRGRLPGTAEVLDGAPVAVVNESFARRYFADAAALGRHVTVPGFVGGPREIIGVVRDAKHRGVRMDSPRMVYIPGYGIGARYRDPAFLGGSFFVRTAESSVAIARLAADSAKAVDPSVQVEEIRPLESIVGDMESSERLAAALSAVFGGVALLFSAIGLFSVMAYSVAMRTAELGIRMALGARPGQLRWLILRETTAIVAAGMAIGGIAAFGLTGAVKSMLFGVSPNDGGVFWGAAAVLGVAAMTAGFLPAWRASRMDPVAALRYAHTISPLD